MNETNIIIRDALVDELSRWFGSFNEFENRIVIRKVSIMARLPSCESQIYHMDGTKANHFFAVWPLGINSEEGKCILFVIKNFNYVSNTSILIQVIH